MRGARGRADAAFTRALLEARAPLHLGYRLAVRFNQMAAADGPGAAGAPWLAALVAFCALDVAIWFALRRRDSFGLWWRLPLDAADVAVWSLAPDPARAQWDAAALIAVPLAMETGVRHGWRGVLVVVPLLATSVPARLVAHRPAVPLTMVYVVLAVFMGAALLRYCTRLQAQADLARDRYRAAEHGRAVLAGENAVAMGASSVVDTIEGLVPILGPPDPDSALHELASGWKSRLGRATAVTATYLQVALLQWERAHNRHPDLSGLVTLRVAEGVGTVMLTDDQVRSLWSALGALDLRGPVPVDLAPGSAVGRPGGGLTLDVAGRTVTVPPDEGPRQHPVDPGPVIFGWAAVLSARDLLPGLGDVAPWAVGTGVAAMIAGGRWAHHRIRRLGPAARPRVALMGSGLAIGYGALTGAAVQTPASEAGLAFLPLGGAGYLITLLGGLYWRELSRPARSWLAGAFVALVTVHVLARLPAPAGALDVALAVSWPLSVFPTALSVGYAVARTNADLARQARRDDHRLAAAGFEAGRCAVIDLVSRAHDEASRRLAGADVDGELATAARARLEEVERRLIALSTPAGSSSSTTTS